jgi:flotillin
MAQTPSNNRSDEMNSESLESLWRQALLIPDFARDEVDATRRRRADAEQARQQAEQDSIRATEELCVDIRAEAQTDLEEAQATLETAREHQVHAEAELEVARSIKEQAETDSAKVRNDAQEAATVEIRAARKMLNDAEGTNRKILSGAEEQATIIITEATAEAEASVAKLRAKATEEIQRIAIDIEAARVAAEEELETQRILTDTIRIKSPASKVSDRKERRRRRAELTPESVMANASARKSVKAAAPKPEVVSEPAETPEVSPEEVQATPAKGAVWGKGGRFVKKAETAAAVKAA